MDSTNGTWVMTTDAQTADAVSAILESDTELSPVGICASLDDLALCLQRDPRPLVLVDIDPEPSESLGQLRRMIDRFMHSRFVVMANERRDSTVIEAMQAGARHYLAKDTLATELSDTMHQLMPNGHAKGGRPGDGAAVTVLSAAGGTGATTIAVNLASELRSLADEASTGATASGDVLLVDMDSQYGAIASYLGLEGDYGLADVLAHRDAIDPQLVRSTAVRHSEHLDVLLSPATVDFAKPDPIHDQRLEVAIEACKRAYSWTVIDAPRASMDVAATLARASNATLVVMQLTVKDIRCARTMMTALADRGVTPEVLIPVANRFERRGVSVSLDEAQRALGGKTLKRISNDFRSAIEGINFGVPLNESARRSLLRRDLRDLANEFYRVHSLRHSHAAR